MKFLISFLSFLLLWSCSNHEVIKISLIDNDCINIDKLEVAPFEYPSGEYTDSSVTFSILEGKTSNNKIIRFRNISKSPISFFDISKISPFLFATPNNNGSLWINETKENKKMKDCVFEKKQMINITKFNNDFTIAIMIYDHQDLVPNEFIDFEIEFEFEGNYKIKIPYTDSNKNGIGTWGLNKTQRGLSREFKVEL